MENDFIEEQKYLEDTIEIIKENIASYEKNCESGIENVRELSKYHWETQCEMDYIEKAVTRNDVNHSAELTNSSLSTLRNLRRALSEPFFGKIKVDFDGDQEDFYIGKCSVMKKNDIIVNDWRSPISSLFYKSRLGKTSYKAPVGSIDCNLLQRKQMNIKDGKVQMLVNTDIHLTDKELQKVLSKNSDGKMRDIVKTIQEEQNEVISDLEHQKIIVQGCAGSGKTSVGLHRLSYLLYNDHKSTSNNMLIFSPSDVFSSYISQVLPSLNDDNVLETTFSDFANAFIRGFDKIETFSEFLSKYYDGKNTEETNKMNKFKFSKEYKEALDKFIQKYVNTYRFKNNIEFNGIYIPASYLNRFLDNDTTSSLQEKIDMIVDEIIEATKKRMIVKKQTIRSLVVRELIKPEFDAKATYNKFLVSDEFKEAYKEIGKPITKKILEYPDLIGLLYLNFEFMGYPKNNVIHHLVIDEVQDYSPLQMEMIAKMFKGATITALGDSKQTINPYHRYESLEEMKEQLGRSTKYIELNKAYRSSPEIIEYIKGILGDDKIEAVREKTDNPVIIKEVDKKNLFTTLVKDILELKKNGFERICVVTKSSKESTAIFEGLKDSVDNISVLCDNNESEDNLLIAPSYTAKGLEFDAVICYNDYENSYTEEERCLYYVACTRAQHDLLVYNEPKELKMRR